MLSFGLLIGALLLVIGVLTYWLAPRVGPNPLFGMRIGYTYASREIWDKSNRLGGALMAATGLLMVLVAAVLQALPLGPGIGMIVLTGLMVVLLVGETVWVYLYARDLAQGTELARQVVRVRFRWLYIAPTLIMFALTVAVALYFLQYLPADRVASHFGFTDRPDGWMSREGFVQSFIGLTALLPALNLLLVLISLREPLIAFERWGNFWRMEPGQGLLYASGSLALANLLLLLVLVDVIAFNLRGAFLFPPSATLLLTVVLVAALVVLFFLLGRRTSEKMS